MPQSGLKNKVAIVTGSSQGIGKQVALELCRKGAKVVLNGRNEEKLQKTRDFFAKEGFEVLAIPGDIGNYKSCEFLIKSTIEKFGQIDILVNNAGLAVEGEIADTNPEVFQKVVQVNLLGYIYPTQAALPHIIQSKGSIVFNGSIAGLVGLPGFSGYSITKMALTALAQSLRIELKGTGVHVGINYIGFTENERTKTFYDSDGKIQVMPVREGVKKMSVEKVADRIVKGILQRKKKRVFSVLGKLLLFLQRFFPWSLDTVLGITYRTRMKK